MACYAVALHVNPVARIVNAKFTDPVQSLDHQERRKSVYFGVTFSCFVCSFYTQWRLYIRFAQSVLFLRKQKRWHAFRTT